MEERKVEVVPYRSEWVELFNQEKQKIIKRIKPHEVILYHIGSTSIPGLSAKPIIDILAEVDDITTFDQVTPVLEKEDYIAKGENGIVGRRFFLKNNPGGERIYHLHAFEKGNFEVVRHLVFRDYLREHPKDAERYAIVKLTAASQYPYDIESYMNFKDPIIKEIEKKALEWTEGK